MDKKTVSSLMLFLAALIWGSAFVAQSVGMDYIGPFTFQMSRSLIASLALLPVSIIALKKQKKENLTLSDRTTEATNIKALLKGGISCGILLFLSCSAQQIGLVYTSVGKAGFITALYLIIVPLMGLFWGVLPQKKVWFCCVSALFGMYLLCFSGESSINIGDVYVLICAVMYSFHILTINKYSKQINAIALNNVQFFVCAVLSFIAAVIFEQINISDILKSYIPILYAGVLSGGVAYSIQIAAQKHVSPPVASLIMSLESVFSALFGFLILHELMSAKELIGCVVVFISVLIADVNFTGKSKRQPVE